jgi:hypothetical protein
MTDLEWDAQWSEPFSLSLLSGDNNVVVWCPTQELARGLILMLSDNGIHWRGSNKEMGAEYTNWEDYEEETCYFIDYGTYLTYGNRGVLLSARYSSGYTKCRFYGGDFSSDFEPKSEEEIRLFLEK